MLLSLIVCFYRRFVSDLLQAMGLVAHRDKCDFFLKGHIASQVRARASKKCGVGHPSTVACVFLLRVPRTF